MAQIDINRSPQASGILRDIIAEDDAPHRALARARLTHKQHFLLLLFLGLGGRGSHRLVLELHVRQLILHRRCLFVITLRRSGEGEELEPLLKKLLIGCPAENSGDVRLSGVWWEWRKKEEMDGKFVMICSITCMIYDLGYLSISLRYLLHSFDPLSFVLPARISE